MQVRNNRINKIKLHTFYIHSLFFSGVSDLCLKIALVKLNESQNTTKKTWMQERDGGYSSGREI